MPNVNLEPNMLVYMVMCYLGISPGPITEWLDALVQAIFDTYAEHHKDIRLARQAFARTEKVLQGLSMLSILTFWLHFLLTGILDLLPGIEVPIPPKRLSTIRRVAFRAISRGGVKLASLRIASQVLRKVFDAGCGVYVGLRRPCVRWPEHCRPQCALCFRLAV